MRCVPLVVAGLVALSGCAAGCVSSGPDAASGSGAVFAAQAEEWVAAYDEAFDRFDDGQVIFLAPDIVQDSGMSNEGFMGDGRLGALGVHSVVYNTEYERGPMYLDATGLVRTDSWVWPSGDAGRGLSPGQTYALLAWLEVGEDGVERYQHLVYGLDGYASIAQRESQVVAEQVAANYVDVWNDADDRGVAALYAQDATLSDSVLGVRVSGRDAIQALLDDPTTLPVRLDHLDEVYPPQVLPLGSEGPPPDEAPAVHEYLTPDLRGTLSQVWMHLHTTTDCPDASVVALTLDERGHISAERRFHSLDSLRTCTDPDLLVDGWWADLPLPDPLAERVTGTLPTEAGTIELHNSGPAYDQLITWAFHRLTTAGLPPPTVATITLDPFDERCAGGRGYADWSTGTTDILVCADGAGVHWGPGPDNTGCTQPGCIDQAPTKDKHLLLHEIAHAWLHDHLDPATRTEFTTLVNAPSWNDPEDPWKTRGVEWAAEILAWGLNDQPPPALPSIGSPNCDLITDGYQTLTGTPPPHDCP